MRFEIGKLVGEKIVPQNQFIIVCFAESGDGDYEEDIKFGPFDNNEKGLKEMEETIKTFNRMDQFFEENDCFVKSYNDVEGFQEWIKSWPNDVTSDGECLAYYAGHNVFYYDENYNKYRVNVFDD